MSLKRGTLGPLLRDRTQYSTLDHFLKSSHPPRSFFCSHHQKFNKRRAPIVFTVSADGAVIVRRCLHTLATDLMWRVKLTQKQKKRTKEQKKMNKQNWRGQIRDSKIGVQLLSAVRKKYTWAKLRTTTRTKIRTTKN